MDFITIGSQVPRFHTLISSVTVLQSCESDTGITIATGVSAWNDISGQGKHYTQATTGNQPTYTGNLSGYPIMSFDGVDDVLVSTLVVPAPSITPTWIWGVMRLDVSVNGARFNSPNGSNINSCLVTANVGGNIATFGGTAGNAGGTIGDGNWSAYEAYFSSSTSDYCRWGGTTGSGTNSGNINSGLGRIIGKQGTNTNCSVSYAAIMYCNGKPTTAEIANLNACAQGKYRGVLVGV